MDDTPNTTEPKKDNKVMEVIPPSEQYYRAAEAKSLEFMNPKRWQVMQAMAQTFISSGAVPDSIKNTAQMIMVFQAGYEAGMQPLEALNAFYIVNGKITMYGDAVTSQVIKHGHTVEWGECDENTAEVTITRGDNKKSMTGTFTIERAIERGLTQYSDGRPNVFWKKYPANMLKYKALGEIVDFIVPDALHGAPIKENIEADIDPVIATVTQPKMVPAAAAEPAKAVSAESRPSLQEALKKPTVLENLAARGERLEKLGLEYSSKEDAYILNDFNVAMVELKTLDDDTFDKLITEISEEMEKRNAKQSN